MIYNNKPQPAGAGVVVGAEFPTNAGGASRILPLPVGAVKPAAAGMLILQAEAAERRALALAAWHTERAQRFFAWFDVPWARQRFAFHVGEAEFQTRLAARHAAIREALEGVQP